MTIDPEIVTAAKNRDTRPSRGAWSPGAYLNRCSQCGDMFIGNKRAFSCAPCAYQDLDRIKKPRFKLSPELCDGDSWTVVDTKKDALAAVQAWFDEADMFGPGESFNVSIVEMSDREVERLKEAE